jgi:3'-phosphoadenosine 5'-phosphosulfate sulfotransferase (PAPS reductase)/FAD synthetase
MLGLNQETLAVIAKNPVVKEYVRRLEKAATLTDRDYPNTSKIIMELEEEFLKKLSESQSKEYGLLKMRKLKMADSEFKVTKDF